MSDDADVHLADVGTKYRVRVLDDGSPFDISTATTKQLIFKFNDNTVVTRTGTIEEDEDTGDFYLTYTVSEDTFHTVLGPFQIQAKLVFSDDSSYHSNIVTTDDGGRILQILPNLDEE